ncbi:MAG: outer membrane beta-barrel protein [Desulfatibacillum sp.]|nr:outer membrane beta-barrel protein [Desulfatibacillum sp.]
MLLSTPKSNVSLDYTASPTFYDDADDLQPGQVKASEGDYVGHSLRLSAMTQPTDRIELGLDESYYLTRDPDKLDAYSNETGRDKYFINTFSPRVLYRFGERFSAQAAYRNTLTDYDDSGSEDNQENRGIFDVVYNLNSKASFDVEYQVWNRDYNKYTSDYTSQQAKLIFRQQFHYFQVEAGAGYQNREFDAVGLEDADTLTYRFAVEGQNPPDDGDPRSYIRAAFSSNFNDAGSGDEYYKGPEISLEGGHKFVEKIYLDLWASYRLSDYESTYGYNSAGVRELREDDTYDFGARLGYRIIDPVVISLEGGYKNRDSNVVGFSYDNTYVMARIDTALEFGRSGN